jgi:uncharacterized protein YrrD
VTRIVRAGDLIGMPVVTLDEGRIVGEVRDVLFDPRRSSFVGFTLRGRGLLSSPLLGFLAESEVASTGKDAVMIASDSALMRDRDAVKQQVADKREAPGSEVVTASGTALGTINDVVLEIGPAGLAVVGYCVDRGEGRELIVPALEGAEWDDAMIVPDGAETASAEGLVGFSRILEQLRAARGGVGL